MPICSEIFVACPWMVNKRRAPPIDRRRGITRVQKRLLPAILSGLEDILGRGGEVPTEGAPLLLVAAQTCGSVSQAEGVALESLGRIRLGRAPHTK